LRGPATGPVYTCTLFLVPRDDGVTNQWSAKAGRDPPAVRWRFATHSGHSHLPRAVIHRWFRSLKVRHSPAFEWRCHLLP